jgi:cobalt-zinc-cadmium efflux system protein
MIEGLNHPPDGGEVMKGRRFIISILITCLTLVAELLGGVFTGSLALLSDAAHVFLDIFALGLSYLALRLASRAPSARHTFGFRRMKVVAAFVNGATLLAVAFEILREAISRLVHPVAVDAAPMLVIAAIGLAANLMVALLLRRHDHEDLNTRSAFLHVLGDALSSLGVIAAGIVLYTTGWSWVDPAASVLIAGIILLGSGRVLKAAIHILNEGSPKGASVDEVASAITEVPGVREVHDVHVWTIEPGYPVLSAHVLLHDQALGETQSVMERIKDVMRGRFGITQTTIQFECANRGQGPVACVAEGEPAR